MPVRRARALRGTAAAAVAVVLASTSHTLAGGGAPPPWLLLAVTILASPLSVALVGRRRSLPRLAAAVVIAQVALHAAFAAVGTAAWGAGNATHGGHQHAIAPLDLAVASPAVTTVGASMVLAHIVAAAATVVLLAWGEQMLAAIASGIRRLLRLAPVPAAHGPRHAPPSVFLPRRTALAAVFPHSVSRRGPPTRIARPLAV